MLGGFYLDRLKFREYREPVKSIAGPTIKGKIKGRRSPTEPAAVQFRLNLVGHI